jgi:putative endonuclease
LKILSELVGFFKARISYNGDMNQWFTYILRCNDGTLYTGVTNNLDKRIKAHNEGQGASYTRGRGPVILEYSEPKASRSEALKREVEIKKLSKTEKSNLFQE